VKDEAGPGNAAGFALFRTRDRPRFGDRTGLKELRRVVAWRWRGGALPAGRNCGSSRNYS